MRTPRTALTALCALALAAQAALAAPDSLRLGLVLEPPNLDPTAGAAAAIDEVVYANIFEGLTRFGPDGAVQPGLAASWAPEEGGAAWRFALREGVRFHDGTGFDADDVKFSLDRARAEDSTNAQKRLFAGITGVEVLSPTDLRVRLNAPDGEFPAKMAWGDAVILAPESAAQAATAPVGTGPFRFERWLRGDRVEITRNPDYWGDPVALARASFHFIPDPSAAYAALMAGDVDAFPNFPAPETLASFAANPRFAVTLGSTEGETILAMNHRTPALADGRVRAAIAHAIDRQAIIDGAMFGQGTPIGTHFPPHHPDYLDLTGLSDHDPERARALLAEAGQGGLALRLMLPPPSYARRGGEIVAAQLRAVGLDVTITNLEWAQWLEQVFKGHDFDLTIVSHTEPGDLNIYARPEYYFGYDNPAFREVMAALEITTEPARRSELLQQAQRMIAEDHANGFLFQLAKTGVADARIRGLWANAPTQANDLTGVYWED